MIYNALLYIVAAVIASVISGQNEWSIALYSVIAYYVGLKTIDFIVEGFEKGKAALIITEKAELVSGELSSSLQRGITVLDAKGYYSGVNKKMLYVVVNRFEINRLKDIVLDLDESAFVSIIEVGEIMGKTKMYGKKHKDEFLQSAAQRAAAEAAALALAEQESGNIEN